MKKFIATYYFSKEFFVNRIIEAENQEEATSVAQIDGQMKFDDEKGVTYVLNEREVKVFTVYEFKQQENRRGRTTYSSAKGW